MSGTSVPGAGPGSVDGPGALQVDRELATITFRRLLRHPIDDVWAALTEPEQVAAWFMARVRPPPAPGIGFVMEHPNGVRASGRVLEWQPPRAYEYEWNLPPGPDHPAGESSVVRWELSPTAGGTLLVMTHRRLSRRTAEIFVRGIRVLLDRLGALLDGTPLPLPPWASAASGDADSRAGRARTGSEG